MHFILVTELGHVWVVADVGRFAEGRRWLDGGGFEEFQIFEDVFGGGKVFDGDAGAAGAVFVAKEAECEESGLNTYEHVSSQMTANATYSGISPNNIEG
jgi:hypothetical protein